MILNKPFYQWVFEKRFAETEENLKLFQLVAKEINGEILKYIKNNKECEIANIFITKNTVEIILSKKLTDKITIHPTKFINSYPAKSILHYLAQYGYEPLEFKIDPTTDNRLILVLNCSLFCSCES